MAMLLKERARKPIIPADIGITFPTIKIVGGVKYYTAEIREPWAQDGYQIFQLLLTEKEMLGTVAEWCKSLSREKP